ncbi:MAG TPA: GNAT family N-acetyltransferase [Aliidongia sp.]|uniref:GNAT family N-acetyltransferase n=1 Tax=Aliidongia sp. TaxID=1914230 RepID=UPI002DDD78B0|nr:GNAT family N-acetyltransferase [Aliidongia sp.]HEV2678556.1 GNAT family N-acetyltransferase [Aliidongia sp.]
MRLTLTLPRLELGAGYVAALEEGFQFGDGRTRSALEIVAIEAAMVPYLTTLNIQGGTVALPDGKLVERMPHSHLWLTDGADFLGVFNIRYRLNARLRQRGGHIGYAIRPGRQGQGLATAGLGLAMAHTHAAGIGRVLVTCADMNAASARVIERNGGLLEEILPDPETGALFRRYWIEGQGFAASPVLRS